jgi:hypothetical protein
MTTEIKKNGAFYAVYHNKHKNKLYGKILSVFEDKAEGQHSNHVG